MPTQNVRVKRLQVNQTSEIQIPATMSNWTPVWPSGQKKLVLQNFTLGKNKLKDNSHFHRVHKEEMNRAWTQLTPAKFIPKPEQT